MDKDANMNKMKYPSGVFQLNGNLKKIDYLDLEHFDVVLDLQQWPG